MKKLLSIIIVIISATFLSCDSNNPSDSKVIYLKTIANGIPLHFDTFKIEKNNAIPTDGGTPYTDLIVTLTNSNDKTKKILLQLAEGEIGTESCYYFVYNNDIDPNDLDQTATDYQYTRRYDRDKFTINITENSNNSLKGTFSGTLLNY